MTQEVGPIKILLEVFMETSLCGLVRHGFYKFGYLCFRMHFCPWLLNSDTAFSHMAQVFNVLIFPPCILAVIA